MAKTIRIMKHGRTSPWSGYTMNAGPKPVKIVDGKVVGKHVGLAPPGPSGTPE